MCGSIWDQSKVDTTDRTWRRLAAPRGCRRVSLLRLAWTGCAPLALAFLAGCGGGGGGGGGSSSGSMGNQPRSFFETTEYFANRGLGAINASSAYAAGATGNGVLVGLIDTGIDLDHPEFAGAIDGASTDIVGGSAATFGDVDGHGTAVGGIIAARRNGALAHGAAFDAHLLVVRADAPGSCPGACAFDQALVAANPVSASVLTSKGESSTTVSRAPVAAGFASDRGAGVWARRGIRWQGHRSTTGQETPGAHGFSWDSKGGCSESHHAFSRYPRSLTTMRLLNLISRPWPISPAVSADNTVSSLRRFG